MQINEESLEHLRRIGGDGFVAKIITVFLESAPSRIEQLRSSIQSGDFESAGRAAHSLKSSVSNFGVQRTMELASAVETLSLEKRDQELQEKAAELDAELQQLMEEMRAIVSEERVNDEKSSSD